MKKAIKKALYTLFISVFCIQMSMNAAVSLSDKFLTTPEPPQVPEAIPTKPNISHEETVKILLKATEVTKLLVTA